VISSGHLCAFAAASFVLIVVPGPSVLFVVGRALAHGRRAALATVAGNAVGVYVVAALVAFGLGAIVQRSVVVFSVVKLGGACYLIWLGLAAIRHRHELDSAFDTSTAPRGPWLAARQGFVVGVANPKAFILFAAILPQFVDRSAGHVPAQMLLLGLVSFVIALISDSCWALAASTARSWFARSPRRLGLVGGAGGIAMVGVGVSVAVTGRKL
jgi:threonine/homoserine/homoserine lactone efflux protein